MKKLHIELKIPSQTLSVTVPFDENLPSWAFTANKEYTISKYILPRIDYEVLKDEIIEEVSE